MSRSQVTIETLMSVEEIAINDTHYTSSRKFHDCTGNAAILLTLTSSGHATATVTQQCSMDNVTWYEPITTAGAANTLVITAIDHEATPAYIIFDPVLAEYIRFKVHVDTAIGFVTLQLAYRLEV
jgi:hypothetical protein